MGNVVIIKGTDHCPKCKHTVTIMVRYQPKVGPLVWVCFSCAIKLGIIK